MKDCGRTVLWKDPMLLLAGIGIANVGAWIYLIALNLIILDRTGSPLAVGMLYILKPLAAIVTNSWSGSVIDRLNKRTLMVILDVFRALLVIGLPFIHPLWIIFLIVFLVEMAGAMFMPTSMSYMTRLIPPDQRKRFNSLRSLIDSGGFLTGPAVAGLLFIVGSPDIAISINGMALMLSATITLFMPNLEQDKHVESKKDTFSIDLIKKDWKAVTRFSRRHIHVMVVVFLFNCVMVMTAAVDSLEAAFSKDELSLSNSKYGFLVSLAGVGFVVGAMINTVVARKIPISIMIGFGTFTVSLGYIIYALSTNFVGAAIGFIVLSFSLAFADTGFQTFYQDHVPVDMMGRIGSIYSLIEAVLVILTTTVLGILAEIISSRVSVVSGVVVMCFVTIALIRFNAQRSKIITSKAIT